MKKKEETSHIVVCAKIDRVSIEFFSFLFIYLKYSSASSSNRFSPMNEQMMCGINRTMTTNPVAHWMVDPWTASPQNDGLQFAMPSRIQNAARCRFIVNKKPKNTEMIIIIMNTCSCRKKKKKIPCNSTFSAWRRETSVCDDDAFAMKLLRSSSFRKKLINCCVWFPAPRALPCKKFAPYSIWLEHAIVRLLNYA